ncbi:MAG: hydantoinase/oxoprolinase family protein [Pseudomonadota bacterium]
MSGTLVGVDVGGTFTDLFFLDPENGRVTVKKVPSARGEEAHGFLEGLGETVPNLSAIVHGTTVGTNALLERKGGRVGLITTSGFGDVLEMRRRDRPHTWGLHGSFEPVVPRDLRLEVDERILADGTIRAPLDREAVERVALSLKAADVDAIAIVFINAYANPAHEEAARAAVLAVWPEATVTLSSEILPEIREFERTSTTVLNATLQPMVGRYLERLEQALDSRGFAGRFHIVQSNGGVMSTATARTRPIRTALSGPAAGVIAAGAIAAAAGEPNVITCDLGGTSFDVSLIAGGEATTSAEASIDFGLTIRSPMIEIKTIGAGGGSIAMVDAGGLLKVGPESAGSRPGPVAYGGGNERPTLTDANIVLGRINAAAPIGGGLKRLDVAAAEAAIDRHIAQPLGLSVSAAAEAIIRVANGHMAGALRLVSIERGHDPGRFVAMPFGGGGALHASALVREVGLKGALIPRYPGVTSALGCVIADVRHDQVRTLNTLVEAVDEAAFAALLIEEARAARAVVEGAGIPLVGVETVVALDMHYLGQTHTVAAQLASLSPTRAEIGAAFESAYERAFGRTLKGLSQRIVSVRVSAIGLRPPFDLSALAPPSGQTLDALKGTRPIVFQGEPHESAVYERLILPVGAEVVGPAVLEQPDATVIVEPGMVVRVDPLGNLLMEAQ